MANYCKGFETTFDYPEGLSDQQYAVLNKWWGYDFSYVNMNHPDEFQEFCNELNESNIPDYDLIFRACDEIGMWTCIDYTDKWIVRIY